MRKTMKCPYCNKDMVCEKSSAGHVFVCKNSECDVLLYAENLVFTPKNNTVSPDKLNSQKKGK